MKQQVHVDLDKLYDAFVWSCAHSMDMKQVLIHKLTGRISCCVYELYYGAGRDEFEEPCDHYPDFEDDFVSMPQPCVFYIGRRHMLKFVSQHLPELFNEVAEIFRQPEAEDNFRTLLCQHDLEEKWSDFERTATRRELQAWAAMEGFIAI
jgi:hypothetical protein